jgi:hypothetical protein
VHGMRICQTAQALHVTYKALLLQDKWTEQQEEGRSWWYWNVKSAKVFYHVLGATPSPEVAHNAFQLV